MPSVGEQVAHYQLHEPLPRPEGSATEAFRALDTQSNVEVVLEVVREGATSVEKARFATRVRRLSGLKHPSLVKALAVTATYCVFEPAQGEPLIDHAGLVIARTRQKLAWLAQIAGALAALHKVTIIHGQVALDQVVVMPDLTVKVSIPVGGDVSGLPLDDVRAFGAAACQLVLGTDAAPGYEESHIVARLNEAGMPAEAANLLGRARAGNAITSADLAEKLAPFIEYSGPSTEPLMQVVAQTEPLLQVARRSSPGDGNS